MVKLVFRDEHMTDSTFITESTILKILIIIEAVEINFTSLMGNASEDLWDKSIEKLKQSDRTCKSL